MRASAFACFVVSLRRLRTFTSAGVSTGTASYGMFFFSPRVYASVSAGMRLASGCLFD